MVDVDVIIQEIAARNSFDSRIYDLDYSLNLNLKVVDFSQFKKARETAYDLIVERCAIENIEDEKEKALALSVWWRRLFICSESTPEFFPQVKTIKKKANLVLVD